MGLERCGVKQQEWALRGVGHSTKMCLERSGVTQQEWALARCGIRRQEKPSRDEIMQAIAKSIREVWSSVPDREKCWEV